MSKRAEQLLVNINQLYDERHALLMQLIQLDERIKEIHSQLQQEILKEIRR